MRRPSTLARSVVPYVFVFVAWALFGCAASVPRVDAQGTIAGYPLAGPVDGEIARDYLEGRPLPVDLAITRARILASGQTPSPAMLARISRRYSPDVATLLLIEAVSATPATKAFRRRFEAELAHIRKVGLEGARPRVPPDLMVLLVPGWFYVSHGKKTNADYHIQRQLMRRWNIPHRLVPLDENGTIEGNARIVARAIRQASADHRILVVSASKSGAEVALALGRELDADEASAVVGWLSMVGVVRGSPLADRVLESDICWFTELKLGFEGFDLEGVKSMQTSRAGAAFRGLRLPRHVRTVAFVAAPLSGHISDRGEFGYGVMRELGPNDGLTLLRDELIPGAVPVLAPGEDHFLGREDQRVWSTALFRLLLADLQERPR